MKLSKLVGERFKERPSDCLLDSHALMVRGGYIKNVANGIYSSFTPMKRVARKIEQIIREEMDKIDGQEVVFPVVLPASLWEESGRYDSVGSELLRFSDRNDSNYVLGMTHEEAAVHLVREYGAGYSRYPFMIYQIQTKFRDEARPRGGLIRVREFTMKDAYSFHTSQQDLEQYYARCHTAYERIFKRVGLPQVISVASDSGMMGGSLSHEFMLLSPIGEDSIVTCSCCDFKANMEATPNIVNNVKTGDSPALSLVSTPDMRTIDDLCNFFGVTQDKTCKSVVYQKENDGTYVVLFIRGDYEVNESKLKNILKSDIAPVLIDDNCGLIAGFIGPYNLQGNFTILYDCSLENSSNLICGGNKLDYHYSGLDIGRDVGSVEYVDVSKATLGGICPNCKNTSLNISRGVEVGNIFQLGTKYTAAMNMTYLDENGNSLNPIMGCYGIGVGRLAASVCEANHDDFGIIWPTSIAPWQVHLCAIRADNSEVKFLSDSLYDTLTNMGIEVIYDDRSVSAGIMFSDADLLGVPLRVVVSPRNIKDGCIEISSRDKSISLKVKTHECISSIKDIISKW